MIEDFLNAISNFRRNKTRTFLSLLGIIIGVASVIVIMSMGQSSSQEIEDTFDSSGPDMVSVSKGFFRRNRSAVTINFDEEFREELFGEIEGIKKIWYENNLSATVSYDPDKCFGIMHSRRNRIHADFRNATGIR